VLDSNVLDFALTSDGRVWVGTGQGVGRVDLRDGAILPFVTQEALATFDVHGALVDEDGTTWLATAEGIARRDADGHWRIFHLGDGLPGPQVWSVTRGPNGARFFGVGEQLVRGGIGSTGSGGIVRITGRDEIEVLASEAMGGFDPRALEIDDDGGLWVGLAQQLAGGGPARPAGLMRWHPSDGVQLFGPRHGMASERVEELLFDEEGRLYVVHGRTLASGVSVRDPDGHWSVISTMEGLPSLNVTDVALDGRGGLYFTTLAGVGHRHADGTWSTYDRRAGRAGLGFDPVSSVTVDRSGRAWFAALPNVVGPHAGRGLAILNPGGSGR
jgi:ligand-binding sensor domain-containing protein